MLIDILYNVLLIIENAKRFVEVNGKSTSTCVCVSLHYRDFLTSAPVVIYLTAVLLTLVYVAYEH